MAEGHELNDHFSWLDEYEPQAGLHHTFADPPRQKSINVDRYIASHGGRTFWGSAFAHFPNTNPDFFRQQGFRNDSLLPTDNRPWDKNIYCQLESGDIYAVISFLGWRRSRRLKQLNEQLVAYQASADMHLEESAMTQGLIYYLGTQWGKYLRDDDLSIPCGWPDADERKTLGISGHGFKRNNSYIKLLKLPDAPIRDMPRNVMEFHKHWVSLSERFQAALWCHFVPIATKNEKAEMLELTLDAYRFLVDDAINAMIRTMKPETHEVA